MSIHDSASRAGRRIPRRAAAASAAIAAAALLIPHFVFAGAGRSAQRPDLVPARASLVAAAKTPAGTAALYAVPAADGSNCITESLSATLTNSSPESALGEAGAECLPAGVTPARLNPDQLTVSMSWLPTTSGVALVISGRAASSVTRVALVGADGSTVPATLAAAHGNYFVSRLAAPGIGELPEAVDYSVVAYDGSGRATARTDLAAALASATP